MARFPGNADIKERSPVSKIHRGEIVAEIRAMYRYGTNLGKGDISAVLGDILNDEDWDDVPIGRLLPVHHRLAVLVWPATPAGLRRVEPSHSGRDLWRFLGPFPLIRWLIVAALTSLGASAALFAVEPDVLREGITGKNVDIEIAVPFVIAAAGMGSSFYALFTIFRFVSNRTYDSARNSSYIVKFVLGLVSGLILVFVVYGAELDLGFGTALIAIIGGFSSDVVYRILTRLTQTVEFMILGDNRDRSDSSPPPPSGVPSPNPDNVPVAPSATDSTAIVNGDSDESQSASG